MHLYIHVPFCARRCSYCDFAIAVRREVPSRKFVDAVLSENAETVARYRAGNQNLLGVFVGMVMKKTGGKANPKLLQEVLKKKLGAVG